jgi:NADP-dependent 3-hydroxy acid dehydrogenase YdfG
MKIAITGHTNGIGKALADVYTSRGHEIIGLSRSNGYNIRSIPKCADAVESCDMFINNAQAGFAQTELLFEVWRRWRGKDRTIISISSQITNYPVSTIPDLDEYWLQKNTLDQAHQQLRYASPLPRLVLVKPGDIATQPDKTVPPSASSDSWAMTLVNMLEMADPVLTIADISLGPKYDA